MAVKVRTYLTKSRLVRVVIKETIKSKPYKVTIYGEKWKDEFIQEFGLEVKKQLIEIACELLEKIEEIDRKLKC